MPQKPKLRELIAEANCGSEEALFQLVHRFIPVVKKYSRRLGYEEAYADLVMWIIKAVRRYEPHTTWGRDELKRYFSKRNRKHYKK